MSEKTVKMQECRNQGCGFTVPIGYLSINEWCADCENTRYRRALAESLDRQRRLDSIREIAFQAPV
jgi:hypothetical protein